MSELHEGQKPVGQSEGGGPTLEEILVPIWKERKRILMISFVVALITLGINFLLPKYYKSVATLLPETQKDKLSALGQFADIASLAGVSVPGSEIARLYPTIVKSETILRSAILKKYKTIQFSDSVNLVEYFDYVEYTPEENIARTLGKVQGLLSATHDNKNSVVTLAMEMPEPELSAAVLNTLMSELDGFMRSKRVTNASEQVKWISVRIKEIEGEVKAAEERLKDFRERNRRVADSPQLLLDQERLARDVQVKATVFIELKKQYELAKLEEIKNITIVNVLDPARVPVTKSRPKRLTNAAIAGMISTLLLSAWVGGKGIYGGKVKALRARLAREK